MMIFERTFVKKALMGTFCITGNNKYENKFLPLVNIWQIRGFATGKFYQFLYEDLKVTETPLFDWI